jgi:Ca-activated chloride channel homolog
MLLTTIALLTSFLPHSAATLQKSNSDDGILTLKVRLVNLNVSVTDDRGRKVVGLKQEDFLVSEDRVQQDIIHFQPVNAPVNLVLLIDLSGSIGSKLQAMKKAAKRFIDSLKEGDNIAVATFTSRFNLVSGFTTDRKSLKEAINKLEAPIGDTAFYDAGWMSFDLLDGIKESRKALVVLTDGVDSSFHPDEKGSQHTFDELIGRAVEADTTVYPIYFDTEPENGGYYSAATFSTARRQLEELASQTGGAYFRARRIEDLDDVYQQVSAELHSIYSIAYEAKDARKTDRWRLINVKVNRDGVKVKSKRGYYAR